MLLINEITRLYLGVQGENNARTITIDVSEWLKAYPNGNVTIWSKRNGEHADYTPTGIEFDRTNKTISWTPSGVDTFYAGAGWCGIVLSENGLVRKSKNIETYVTESASAIPGADANAFDYDRATHKPKINNVELEGNQTLRDLNCFDDDSMASNTKTISAAKATVELNKKVDKASIENNLTTTAEGKVLDARQGKALDDKKIDKTSITNNLTTTAEGLVLDARQGKALDDKKIDKTSIVENLNTTAEGTVLGASQGKELDEKKIDKDDIVNTLTEIRLGKVLDARQGKALEDKKVDRSQVTDNLSSGSAENPLSANMGKYLNEKKINNPAGVSSGKYLQTDSFGDPVWGDLAPATAIGDAVDTWMTNHAAGGTALTIDDTLSQTNAAAQSKAAGDGIKESQAMIAPPFSSNDERDKGQYVTHDGDMYQLTADHLQYVSWEYTSKQKTDVGDELNALQEQDAEILAEIGEVPLPTTAQTLTGAIAEHESDLTAEATARTNADNELKSALNIDEHLINIGQYQINASDLEQGYWAYSTKNNTRTDRLRNIYLIHVKNGMRIRYSNPTMKVYFGVLETQTSNTYLQTSGWIQPSTTENVYSITNDGYLTFMVENTGSSPTPTTYNSDNDIMPSDYDSTVTIQSKIGQRSFLDPVLLGSSDNIDNLFKTGNYYAYSSSLDSIGGTFPTTWTKNACTIVVLSTWSSTNLGVVQFLVGATGLPTTVYVRRYNGSAWDGWRMLTDNRRVIYANADINTFVIGGEFSFTSANAETFNGLPDNFIGAGVLSVITGETGVGRTVQVVYNSNNRMWTRYHNDNYDASDSSVGWSAWNEVTTINGSLGAVTDVNTILTIGSYSFTWANAQQVTFTGLPSDFAGAGVLNVFAGAANSRRTVQTLYSSQNKMWLRYHNDEFDPEDTSVGWTEWKNITEYENKNLADNTNINRMYSPGQYSFYGVTAQTMTGLPTGYSGPGVLSVMSGSKRYGRTVQMLNNYQNKIWFRYHNDDYSEEDDTVGWTSWINISSIDFDASKYMKHRTASALRPIGLPSIWIEGDMTGISKDNTVNITWRYKTNAVSGTGIATSDEYSGTLKWQGRGSLSFPKKNFTLNKIKKTVDGVTTNGYDFGWGTQTKYCLKGNYLDPSMANNLTGAKLWGDLAADHSETYPAQLVSSPNYGTVDGFPIMLFINEEYQGVYDLNVPKDKWMADMTLAEGTAECIVCSDASTDTCAWAALAETLEDLQTGWCLEELSKGIVEREGEDKYTGVALHALNQAIEAVMTAYTNEDTDWEETVGEYIDIDSAIDFYILRCLIDDRDAMKNNQLLMTYNLADPRDEPETPTKWYFIPYDMDMTFGASNLYYDNERLLKIGDNRFKVYASQNRLFWLIYNYSKNRLKARYTALRKYHLSYRNVYYRHGGITAQIPAGLMDYEHTKWPLVPADNVMSTAQAMEHYRINCEVCDEDLYDESLLNE